MLHLGEYGPIAPGDLQRRVGCLSQIASARFVMFTDGRAAGVRAVQVATGSGLAFSVLVDRSLDLYSASYRGLPLAWESGAGVVAPDYYEPGGDGWLSVHGAGACSRPAASNRSARRASIRDRRWVYTAA
jgi:hypothetical protein